jgi:hypothetical protein
MSVLEPTYPGINVQNETAPPGNHHPVKNTGLQRGLTNLPLRFIMRCRIVCKQALQEVLEVGSAGPGGTRLWPLCYPLYEDFWWFRTNKRLSYPYHP